MRGGRAMRKTAGLYFCVCFESNSEKYRKLHKARCPGHPPPSAPGDSARDPYSYSYFKISAKLQQVRTMKLSASALLALGLTMSLQVARSLIIPSMIPTRRMVVPKRPLTTVAISREDLKARTRKDGSVRTEREQENADAVSQSFNYNLVCWRS